MAGYADALPGPGRWSLSWPGMSAWCRVLAGGRRRGWACRRAAGSWLAASVVSGCVCMVPGAGWRPLLWRVRRHAAASRQAAAAMSGRRHAAASRQAAPALLRPKSAPTGAPRCAELRGTADLTGAGSAPRRLTAPHARACGAALPSSPLRALWPPALTAGCGPAVCTFVPVPTAHFAFGECGRATAHAPLHALRSGRRRSSLPAFPPAHPVESALRGVAYTPSAELGPSAVLPWLRVDAARTIPARSDGRTPPAGAARRSRAALTSPAPPSTAVATFGCPGAPRTAPPSVAGRRRSRARGRVPRRIRGRGGWRGW